VSISGALVRLHGEIGRREEERMRYLALIYGDESDWEALSAEDEAAVMEQYNDFAREAAEAGVMTTGEELDSTSTATTVRVRGDETIVTDGPFAELKETLGGFFVLECDSIDEACRWAAKIPGASHGAVEVRPVHAGEGA
jgi:hypothetical protein